MRLVIGTMERRSEWTYPLGRGLATVGLVLVLLALDFVVGRNPHDVSMREATPLVGLLRRGRPRRSASSCGCRPEPTYGTQYYAAWLVEKSLSVDNLFIFVIIFAKFAVPSELQQRALLIGVTLALVLRADLHRRRRRRARAASRSPS